MDQQSKKVLAVEQVEREKVRDRESPHARESE